MKKYFLLSLVLLPAIVLGAVTPNVTNLASFSKEQLIKVIECLTSKEGAGYLSFCLEKIGGPVVTSYNESLDINGTIDIKGKNFGPKVRVELAYTQGDSPSNYRKAIDLNTTGAGTIITVPLFKLITTEQDKNMFVGNYNTVLNITRLSDGVTVNAGYISITEDLVADKVVIGEGARLTKTLVSGKETLVATFSVTLRSEKKSATTIPKADPAFGVIAYNPLPKAGSPFYAVDGAHDAFSKNTYVKTAGEAIDYGTYYIIPEGKSATFRVTATFNPLLMFGGNYVAKVRSVSYGDSAGKWAVQILPEKTPRNKTNDVVVVGEKSPYIIGATPSKEIPSDWNGLLILQGVRFGEKTYAYLVNSSGVTEGVLISKKSATELTVDTTKFPVSSGNYDLFIKDIVNGESNRFNVMVKGATTIPPVDETGSLNCPTLTGYAFTKNLSVGSTDSPDVLALQCFLISKGHLASNVKSGYFGALTKAALVKYQQSKGEEVATGYFGPVTRAVVNADLASVPVATTSVRVISPNGGEVYKFDQGVSIRWQTDNFSTSSKVYIELRPDGTNLTPALKIDVVSSLSSSYNWYVPNNIIPGKYIIELYKANSLGQIDQNEAVKDVSDSSFSIIRATSTPATTTASSLILEKVSSSVSQDLGLDTTSSDDQGVYNFTFKVTPVGGYAYIPLTASRSNETGTSTKGVLFWIENDSNSFVSEGQTVASLSSVSGGTRSGNYIKVEEGERATFRLSATFDPASTTAPYRLQMWSLNYGGAPSAPTKTAFFSPQENFETSVVIVLADIGSQIRNTASIWEAIKSFFK